MKVWIGYGSEHSSNLKLIGRFQTEEAAKAAEQLFERLRDRVYADLDAETYDGDQDSPPDLSDEIAELLRELKLYSVGPADVENFAYDHSVRREGADFVLTTDENNIGGFVKILVDVDAKIEIFSLHSHTDNGERKDES
ncbi:DUF6375 family protein [Patulibacter minatonensis]|uniref:DUF6375 family protein n=1 Tax=Patulibacter minatonensis TaxID=298163 RepID=UPI00047D9C72|nr:DUF6375 family protein [Patulibacter minatonensis]